jgi:hypothetical protein
MAYELQDRYTVYGVYDPREPEHIRYIGCTRFLLADRMALAFSVAKHAKWNSRPYWIWLGQIWKQGVRPAVKALYRVRRDEDWGRAERRWIAKLKSEGHQLLNMTLGGPGGSGPEHSARTITRLSGQKLSPETRAKISAATTGRKLSPEARAKLSATFKGRKFSPEWRAKLSAAAMKRWASVRAARISSEP